MDKVLSTVSIKSPHVGNLFLLLILFHSAICSLCNEAAPIHWLEFKFFSPQLTKKSVPKIAP
tara:strand:+ start:420 stop:605 length:186 start_codon:yes stop_codon:yes gene_type:complete